MDKKYLDKSQYTPDELHRRKKHLSTKKGQVTRLYNLYQEAQTTLQNLEAEVKKTQDTVNKSRSHYQKSAEYQRYLLAQAESIKAYQEYKTAERKLDGLDESIPEREDQLNEAEKKYKAATADFAQVEEELAKYQIDYDYVNNPVTYGEFLRAHETELAKNREQIRNDAKYWSTFTRATGVMGVILLFFAILILLLGSFVSKVSFESTVPAISAIGAVIMGILNRFASKQHENAQKRFEKSSDALEKLHRDMIELSLNSQPNTSPTTAQNSNAHLSA